MGDFNDDDVDDAAYERFVQAVKTSSFTGLTRSCFPGLLGDENDENAKKCEPANEPPSVSSSATITIGLRRQGCLTEYTWTKEEALLIRDALIEELGGPEPQIKWVPSYPQTFPGIGSPWVSTNVCCNTGDGQAEGLDFQTYPLAGRPLPQRD